MKNFKVRICLRCGGKYVPRSAPQKYCEKCNPRIAHGYGIKICSICKKEYLPTGGRQKRCVECASQATLEQETNYAKKYCVEHPEQTQKIRKKRNAKRRKLGFIALNKPFKNCEAHHVDLQQVVHIPSKLHRSISHNVFTGKNMDKINEVALNYL